MLPKSNDEYFLESVGVTLPRLSDEQIADINLLITQLSAKAKPVTRRGLEDVTGDGSYLFVMGEQSTGKVLGMLTLVIAHKPTATYALIEDVVVHERCRGRGLARTLMREAIAVARGREAAYVELTSHPRREAANALYQALDFQRRETNCYRLDL